MILHFLGLTHFQQIVSKLLNTKNFISNSINVLSGVPQGDHLSPLVFSLLINDINKVSKCLLFSDDTKIFKKKIKCIDDSLEPSSRLR